MRSSSDIYYAATRSSIAIEPEADPEKRRVLEVLLQYRDDIAKDEDFVRKVVARNLSLRGVSVEKIDDAFDYMRTAIDDGDDVGARKALRDEFGSLSTAIGFKGSDLWVEVVAVPSVLLECGIELVSAVRKLREVRAIVGFNRGGQAPDPAFDDVQSDDVVPISSKSIALGYENRGEGIFIRLSSQRILDWLNRAAVADRGGRLAQAERSWNLSAGRHVGAEKPRLVYMLAHSMAHALMRGIALECGYSQASIRERIYASEDGEAPWAGLLLYTSTSDADGSLGGLVGIALEPDRLASIVSRTLTSLAVCSSDPTCSADEPGLGGRVSGASCHACMIAPEPSCERNNRFLDRIIIIPRSLHANSNELCFSAAGS